VVVAFPAAAVAGAAEVVALAKVLGDWVIRWFRQVFG
jgi:hypothetical protein